MNKQNVEPRTQNSEEELPPLTESKETKELQHQLPAYRQEAIAGNSPSFFKNLRQNKAASISLGFLSVLLLASLLSPVISPYKFDAIDMTAMGAPPSWSHLLGTDELGRDLLTRLLYAGRVSLSVGIGIGILSTAIGILIGAVAGYFGGWLDNVLMRLTDLALSLPALPLLMVVGGVMGSGNVATIIVILSLLLWMYPARVVRSSVLSLKNREFVEAAYTMGAGHGRIIFRHILANAWGPVIVNATLTVGMAISVESVLSFLSLGIQPPTPSWGNMLVNARATMVTQPWLTWFPGMFVALTLLAVNFLGDGLNDALGK